MKLRLLTENDDIPSLVKSFRFFVITDIPGDWAKLGMKQGKYYKYGEPTDYGGWLTWDQLPTVWHMAVAADDPFASVGDTYEDEYGLEYQQDIIDISVADPSGRYGSSDDILINILLKPDGRHDVQHHSDSDAVRGISEQLYDAIIKQITG